MLEGEMKMLRFVLFLIILEFAICYRLAPYMGLDTRIISRETVKSQILQLGAVLDRGQAYNPTTGEWNKERTEVARSKIQELISLSPELPSDLDQLDGEWELVYSSVPHGIFRSSPFFLAIQDAYIAGGPDGKEKAQLFFKLHELQTCSWGASKIGRVAQIINSKEGLLISEFDTSIFSLTVIPIVGWFKLLPTFGGCVVTVSKCVLNGDRLEFEVLYTTSKKVPGLKGISDRIYGQRVPVNEVWKLLPWNQGRAPTCSLTLKYLDDDFRIVQDSDDEYFVYCRPVCPRSD